MVAVAVELTHLVVEWRAQAAAATIFQDKIFKVQEIMEQPTQAAADQDTTGHGEAQVTVDLELLSLLRTVRAQLDTIQIQI